MEFKVEALLIELVNSHRQILSLLQEDRKLVREVLDRLPKPQVFYPASAAGSSITVRS
jgi:hypothetical protein